MRISYVGLRHLSRSSRSWGKRVLFISDSLVTIGVQSKGRPPSWPLLRLARQSSAILLACDIRLYMRYVETDRNHLDGPSRGFGLGHAPAWATEQDEARLRETILKARAARLTAG